MKTNLSQITADEAYQKTSEEIKKLIEKISSGLQDHSNGEKNWGHVGDLLDIKETLSDLSDRLNGTGEYAK